MYYKNELQELLKYCKESADYITDEDCTEDKHARMAYKDVIGEIEKIFERKQESSYESAALPLYGVSNNEVVLKAFVEEFIDAWEDGSAGDTELYRKAKSLL